MCAIVFTTVSWASGQALTFPGLEICKFPQLLFKFSSSAIPPPWCQQIVFLDLILPRLLTVDDSLCPPAGPFTIRSYSTSLAIIATILTAPPSFCSRHNHYSQPWASAHAVCCACDAFFFSITPLAPASKAYLNITFSRKPSYDPKLSSLHPLNLLLLVLPLYHDAIKAFVKSYCQ